MIVRVTRNGREISRLQLTQAPVTVGRGASAQLLLDHREISPKQLELTLGRGSVSVRALNGAPRFIYRGQDTREADLVDGESVEVGPYELAFLNSEEAEDLSTPSIEAPEAGDDDEAIDEAMGFALGQLFGDEPNSASLDLNGASEGGEDSAPPEPPPASEAKALSDPVPSALPEEESQSGLSAGESKFPQAFPPPVSVDAEAMDFEAWTDKPAPGAEPEDIGDEVEAPVPEPQEVGGKVEAPVHEPQEVGDEVEAPVPEPQEGANDIASAAAQAVTGSIDVKAPAVSSSTSGTQGSDSQVATNGEVEIPPQIEKALAALGPRLYVVDGEQALSLGQTAIFIGAAQGMHMNLMGPGVARRHAALLFEDGHYILKDLQSESGTRVGGRRVGAWRLRNGEQIQIGNVHLAFAWPAQPASQLQENQLIEEARDFEDESARPKSNSAFWVLAVLVLLGLAAGGGFAYERAQAPEEVSAEQLERLNEEALIRKNHIYVAEQLWEGARFSALWNYAASEASKAGAVDPLMAKLADDAREAQVWGELGRQLWMDMAAERGSHVQTGLLMAEGRYQIRQAELALRSGLPMQGVGRSTAMAKSIVREAERLSPKYDEIEVALKRIDQLTGMAKMREENQLLRFSRESLVFLEDIAGQAVSAGDDRLALVAYGSIVERAEARDGEIKARAEAALSQLEGDRERKTTSLEAAALYFEMAGDLVSARILYERVQTLVSEEQQVAVRAKLEEINEALREKAQADLEQGRKLLGTDEADQAEQLFWRVLEYAPDWSESLHRSARAELEALARSR